MSKKLTKKPAIDGSDLVAVLRQAIADSDRTVNDIAHEAEVSQSVLSRFSRGERTITLPVASRVCKVLGLVLTT